jgi:hypothetical protein
LRIVWKWLVATSIIAILAIGCVAWIGLRSSTPFVRDCAANLVADAIIAILGFWVVTAAFGVWERRQQQTEARHKAFHVLRKELRANLVTLTWLTRTAEQGGRRFRYEYLGRLPDYPPRVKTESWNYLIQSGLVTDLPLDVWSSIVESYSESTWAMQYLIRRANEDVLSEDWSELVDKCLPGLEQAQRLTQDALDKLEKSLPQGE